jgi:Na+-transporting NADH:ubiquinone oxidoreductase subunit NqrB
MFKKILLLGLLGALFAMPVTSIDGNTKYKSSDYVWGNEDFKEYVISGKQILSGNAFAVTIDEVAGYDKIDFYTSAVASGSITTGTLTWYDFGGNSYGSVVITSGVGVTNFKSSKVVFSVSNPVQATNNVTMNIILK